jgi:hypothetical protein
MRRIGRLLFRTAVLAYAAMLIVGAWPYHAAPFVGAPASWASRALGKLSIVPGMPIFNAGQPAPVEWKLRASCQRIVGVRANGDEELLYAPECPPAGFQSGVDSFKVMLLRLARGSSDRQLLAVSAAGPARQSRAVRRYTALGDWFCRASEGAGTRFPAVKLTQQRQHQSYESGALRVSPVLVCRWQCDEEPAPLPRCERLPADAEAAIVGRSSS